MVLVLLLLLQAPPGTCADAADCRTQAQAAAARADYERFHDLAWRAVQKGRPNDPDLMVLLARAQSLSGRPGDALVMLGRILDLASGIDLSVVTSDDFRTVRLLSDWPALEARLTGRSAPSAALPPFAPLAPESLSFDAPNLDPHGLAHDSVSRRFVLGDRKGNRLLVIDEVSRHVVPYVSAASAGFYDDLTAFTIDGRRGDLWVVSAKGAEGASSSVLHKLQLVSGRALLEARPPDTGGVRLVDVTVAPDGTVYALDGIDSRIFRLRPGARAMELAMRLEARRPTALTAADDRVLYVAAEKGLVRVDLGARAATAVKSAEELTDFESLSWRAGSLVGVERVAGGSLVVRVALDAPGLRAQPRQVLAASSDAFVGALGSDSFYYLADGHTIRRLPLK
ncbi:MAG TPA: hypothetical protein VF921_06585 [Vicinamibacterales bacterium]